jgi:hypothetical protein
VRPVVPAGLPSRAYLLANLSPSWLEPVRPCVVIAILRPRMPFPVQTYLPQPSRRSFFRMIVRLRVS